MNETLDVILKRRSVRAYQDRPVEREVVDTIIHCAMRAPTAGNMMLYSIVEIADQALKDALAESCDHQPFIAQAPLVLLFLADYQRWYDFFLVSDVPAFCEAQGQTMRRPGEGDMLLACCDALIAAHTAVIAAEALGVGACYIGDIMERYEYHRELLDLPQYTFPIALVCFGYPKPASSEKALTPRFPQRYIHFKDVYQRLDEDALREMYAPYERPHYPEGVSNLGQLQYARKFSADFSVEMTRSVRAALDTWAGREE